MNKTTLVGDHGVAEHDKAKPDTKPGKLVKDPELNAMETIRQVLERLNLEERKRVLRWTNERYNIIPEVFKEPAKP